jgi:GTPase
VSLDDGPTPFRSGFASLVGRPNVGKSTLLNRVLGRKVSIVSDKAQTTRTEIRGVLHVPGHLPAGDDPGSEGSQVVFLDTPGVHRPRTLLGERCNQRSLATLGAVDVVCLVLDATGSVGPGDRFVAEAVAGVSVPKVVVVNKIDAVDRATVLGRLTQAAELADFDEFVPVSAVTGEGVDVLVRCILDRLQPGPPYYPEGVVSDQPEAVLAAELVREQLLALTRDEVPHSIAVTVEEVDERDDGVLVIEAVIRVERDSQKGIVIGKGGEVLKRAGTAARMELERLLGAPVHLTTRVKVERDWQRRAQSLDRLGL